MGSRIVVALALLCSALPCLAAAADLSFTDSHVHLNDLEAQLRLMNEERIPAAVIFLGGEGDNDTVLAAAAQHPGRLIPFVSVTPEKRIYAARWRAGDVQAVAGELDRRLATGQYKGVGELSIVHFPATRFPETEYSPLHPVTLGIMDLLARKYPRLPVMFHCEVTYLKEFGELLRRYPGVPVIWAHGGYAPFYLTERMVKEHQQLTIELSMRMVAPHPRSPDYWILQDGETVWPQWLALIEAHPARFIVGTDASNRSHDFDVRKSQSVKLLLGQLSENTRRKVAHGNLRHLLGMTE